MRLRRGILQVVPVLEEGRLIEISDLNKSP